MAQFFYDGQIRRYVNQIIRMLSGFKYETSDGKQYTVPVAYGDMTRQVANIIRDNSENKIPSAPRIAVYITDLQMDRSRLSDSSFVSKVHIREREFDPVSGTYLPTQSDGYTVERLMPTPYKLTVKADIWGSNTQQKLQIMEQILMIFNPSIEIQTTDNFIDWTSLSVVDVTNIVFESRAIPVGVDSEISVGTLTLETPIWISPPSKVKRMGIIQDIIMNIHDDSYTFETQEYVNIGGFDIFVYADSSSLSYIAELLDAKTALDSLPDISAETARDLWEKYGQDLNWRILFDQFGSKFKPGISQLFLRQPNGNEIVGTVSINLLDETKLIINFDQDTYNTDTALVSPGHPSGYGKVNAIINPSTYNPTNDLSLFEVGHRFLILEDMPENTVAWGSFSAPANSIIEWTGSEWINVPLPDEVVYVTNLRTRVQYKFDNGEWTRAFEGEYPRGFWRLVL